MYIVFVMIFFYVHVFCNDIFYVHVFVMIFFYVHTCKDHETLLLGEHHHRYPLR